MDPHLCSAPTQRSGSCGWGRDIFWFLQNRRARKTGIWSWVIKWAWWSRKLINLQECFMHLLAISTSFICVIEIDSYGLKYPHWWYWWVTCNFSGCTSVAGGWKLNRSSWAFALFCSWSKDKKVLENIVKRKVIRVCFLLSCAVCLKFLLSAVRILALKCIQKKEAWPNAILQLALPPVLYTVRICFRSFNCKTVKRNVLARQRVLILLNHTEQTANAGLKNISQIVSRLLLTFDLLHSIDHSRQSKSTLEFPRSERPWST